MSPRSYVLKKNPFVSVVIPVLNELENIKTLNKMLKIAFGSFGMAYEVIYIDDYSTDGTWEYLQKIQNSKIKGQNVFAYRKKGKSGKAFSLKEGFSYARGNIFGMIDADLQYPVTALPEMAAMLETADIVVANRKKQHTNIFRKIASWGFRTLFGRILFGIRTDVQSGLKVFTRRVYEAVAFEPTTAWTFDLEFLYRAHEAGFSITNYDIEFYPRKNGESKVRFFNQIFEIGTNALFVRMKRFNPFHIPPIHANTMQGAGIGYKRKQYITHTTLPYHKTAIRTFTRMQKFSIALLFGLLILGLVVNSLITAQTAITIISFIYFIDVFFHLFIIWRSLSTTQEIQFGEQEIAKIDDASLPTYSILCPLYKEVDVIPQFLQAIHKLDWPKHKLEVMLLLEEDDTVTIHTVKKMRLPGYVQVVIIPYSQPKTKPKACNYGLSLAKGEYVVIFDAEDIPEPEQLKKAYLGFRKADQNTICLQAKLNYYNPKQNLLTKFFTAEYSLWFDLTLPGLQSLKTSLPLGGTSNHFKTALLRKLRGWDTFNVTEDADLGIRLFKEGYQTAMIDSTTLEEANSNVHNWLRQRSRWIKGYLQSYLVHTRDLFTFAREKGIHALLMQLVIGTKLTFIFLNPFLWIMTFSYFAFNRQTGNLIEQLYDSPAFYLGAISLVFGNFLFFYHYMIGLAKKNQWDLMISALFIPIYWILISIAGWIALYQLIFKPHYWEKTIHGLHLKKAQLAPVIIPQQKEEKLKIPSFGWVTKFPLNKAYLSGLILISGNVIANFLNFIFNAYLGRTLSFSEFGLISFIVALLSVVSILASSLSATVNYQSSIISGKYGEDVIVSFWKQIRKYSLTISFILTCAWLASTKLLVQFFHLDSVYPILLFAPVLFISLAHAVDRGVLSSRLQFASLGVMAIAEPGLKLIIAIALLYLQLKYWVFSVIPLSLILVFFVGWIAVRKKIFPTNR